MPFDQTTGSSSNVVAFRQARPQSYSRRDQKNLMEAVYSAGSLPVLADDRATKAMAARLQLFGFVVIEEIDADGTARRLRASEAIDVSPARPWRVSKPSAGRKSIGAADASGYLAAGAGPLPAPGAPIAAQASGSGTRLRQHPTITAPAGSDQAPCS